MQLFLFLFFYCLSLSADQIDLNKSKIDQAKEQQHIFGYRECCGNNLFWCKNGLFQFSTLVTSFSLIYISVNLFRVNQRAAGGEIIPTRVPSFLKF